MPQHQPHGVMWGHCGSSKLCLWCLQVWRCVWLVFLHGPFLHASFCMARSLVRLGMVSMMNLQFIPATLGAGTACDTA